MGGTKSVKAPQVMFLALSLYCLLGLNLAVGKTLPWSLLPFHLGTVVWTLGCIGLLALIFSPKLQLDFSGAMQRVVVAFRFWPQLLILANAAFALLNYRHFASFGYQLPWLQLVGCLVVLPWVRADRLWLSVGFSLFFLATSIYYFPLHAERSDMLAVIQVAWDAWKAGGSPYGLFTLKNAVNGMPYLPITFLSHAGAALLGLDLRFNSLFFRTLWMAWLAWRTSHLSAQSPWRIAAGFLILSPYLSFRHDLYFEIFCLLLCAYAFTPRLRTSLVPVLIATRQWSWVLAPFLLLSQCRREGWGRTVGLFVLASGVIGLTLVALLAPTTSQSRFLETVFSFKDRLEYANYPGDYGLTLAPIFYAFHIPGLAQPLQVLAVAACGICALLRPSNEVRWGTIAWIAFLLLNFHFWIYFWISLIVWLVAVGVKSESGEL